MRIAYIVSDYTNSGGMERTIACKANYLVNVGIEVYLISNPPAESKPFFFHDPRIKIIHLKARADKKYRKEYLKELHDCLCNIKPDISISAGLGNARYLYKIKDGSKKIIEIHFSKYNRKHWLTKFDNYAIGRVISDLYTREKNRIAKQYDKFIILTEEDKESWRGLNNIQVIPNALFSVPTEYADLSHKSAIAIGRFAYQKGYEYLIEAWKLVAEKHPDWKLVIYGNGSRRRAVEKRIEKYSLGKVIVLNDPVHDVFKVLLENSIYAMTSRYEGQGLALMEAMACGLPPVSFASKCGPKDIIANRIDGFLVDFGDIEACANRICELIEDRSLREEMGKAARQNILRYTQDKIMPLWIQLFEDLTNKKIDSH